MTIDHKARLGELITRQLFLDQDRDNKLAAYKRDLENLYYVLKSYMRCIPEYKETGSCFRCEYKEFVDAYSEKQSLSVLLFCIGKIHIQVGPFAPQGQLTYTSFTSAVIGEGLGACVVTLDVNIWRDKYGDALTADALYKIIISILERAAS